MFVSPLEYTFVLSFTPIFLHSTKSSFSSSIARLRSRIRISCTASDTICCTWKRSAVIEACMKLVRTIQSILFARSRVISFTPSLVVNGTCFSAFVTTSFFVPLMMAARDHFCPFFSLLVITVYNSPFERATSSILILGQKFQAYTRASGSVFHSHSRKSEKISLYCFSSVCGCSRLYSATVLIASGCLSMYFF